eukprot:809363_1
MSSLIITSLSLLFYSCKSQQGCVPANTCFDITAGNTFDPDYDTSVKFTCENEIVYIQKYEEMGCQTGKEAALPLATTEIFGGDPVSGSSSGSISSDNLQGVGCRVLKNPSEQCQDFMVLKHRGNKLAQEGKYLNIGDNCTSYVGNEQAFTKYSTIYMPVGCVDLYTGSLMYTCDANGWSYTFYDEKGCPPGGVTRSAQSEAFNAVDKCGYFSEWTHCNDPAVSSGCINDGVHDYWWYWYDLDCCPINGKTCCGAPSQGPTAINVGCQLTPRPTTAPIAPTSKDPTSSPSSKDPTSSPVTTQPTTVAPTSADGTAKPTTGKPTPGPTTPGTAKPTAPTTGAPTNIFGTSKPTAPTTGAPTSPGTGKPTRSDVGGDITTTAADNG